MMLLKTLRENFYTALKEDYPQTELQSFFNLLTEYYLRLKRVEIPLNLYLRISGKKMEKFDIAVKRLKNHEPIQYIIGFTEFYGLCFKVTPDTLIPRPETEELVAWILEENKDTAKDLKILDIGTGSGCIAISLAKNLQNALVEAIDISKKAIDVAQGNGSLNKTNVAFSEYNILEWENNNYSEEKLDIIVSNPPYVRQLEKDEMKANVLDYEPDLALFVDDDDPLIFYKTIGEFAQSNLKNGGQLFFEINQYLGEEMVQLLSDLQFKDIILRKDIYGNDRMVFARK